MDGDARGRLAQWVDEHWRGVTCPVCSTNGWDIGGDILEIFPLGAEGVYPFIPITCKTCGNTLLINTVIAGVYPPPPERPPAQEPGGSGADTPESGSGSSTT
jgi:hypothetical protein